MKCTILTAALCLGAGPALAAEGVLIVEKTSAAGTTRTNQIQIERTRMRAESTDAAGTLRIFVFDGTTDVLRMIEPGRKTYTEMTKGDLERLGGQMNAAMAKMQEQLKNLPPEARAKMEAMMRGRGMGGAATAAATEYRKAGTDKVGQWACVKYDGYQNNQKTSEICTVDPKALGVDAADFEVTKELGDFFRQLMPQNAEQMFAVGTEGAQGFSGIPVRRTYTLGGQQIVSELSEISRQTFPESIFAVPEGFQRQAFGMPGR